MPLLCCAEVIISNVVTMLGPGPGLDIMFWLPTESSHINTWHYWGRGEQESRSNLLIVSPLPAITQQRLHLSGCHWVQRRQTPLPPPQMIVFIVLQSASPPPPPTPAHTSKWYRQCYLSIGYTNTQTNVKPSFKILCRLLHRLKQWQTTNFYKV